MGLWIDDGLTENPRWIALSGDAKGTLIELWSYCYRAGNDGVLPTRLLHRASDSFTPDTFAELVSEKWAHKDGNGCGTDTCPQGLDGYTVMHDFVQWQESAAEKRERIERAKRKREEHANQMREWRARKAAKEAQERENGTVTPLRRDDSTGRFS